MAEEDITIEITEKGGTATPPPTSATQEQIINDLLSRLLNAAKGRQRQPAGSGGGGGSGTSGGGSSSPPKYTPSSPTLPPKVILTPADALKDLFGSFHFRVEGLSNLLKGGSNVRLRAIQGMSQEKLSQLIRSVVTQAQTSTARGTGGFGSAAVMGATNAWKGVQAGAARAAAALTAIGPAGWAAIAGLAALAVSIGITTAAYRVAARALRNLTADVGNLSPQIAQARAQAQLMDIQSRMRAGARAGGMMAGQVVLDQEIKNLLRDIKTSLLQQFYPLLSVMASVLKGILTTVKLWLDFATWLKNLVMKWLEQVNPLLYAAMRLIDKLKRDKEDEARRNARKNVDEQLQDMKNAVGWKRQ